MCVDHVLINICSPVINVDRGNQSIDSSEEMAEDALRGNEEDLSALPVTISLNGWASLGIAAEMPEMAECILGCQKDPLPLSSIGYILHIEMGWSQNPSSPSPPAFVSPPTATGSRNHDCPNVHLAVPWGIVAYIQFAKNHRTSLPRLCLHLIFPRTSRGLGVPGRRKVEGRHGSSTDIPYRFFLFDHIREAEGRVPGVESWCDLSSCHCWKAAGQLGYHLAGCKVQVHCLSR